MVITSKRELYTPFMRACWREGISDSLISSVVPYDHSSVSKFRKEEKYPATNKSISKAMIDKLFEIIVPDYTWILAQANHLRYESTVKYWNRHPELAEYYWQLRNKHLDIYPADNPVEEDAQEQCTVESTEPQVEACCADTCPSPIHEDYPEDTETRRKTTIKMQLRDVVHKALEYDMYDLVEDLVKVLEEHF